jgi:hypothetical protein
MTNQLIIDNGQLIIRLAQAYGLLCASYCAMTGKRKSCQSIKSDKSEFKTEGKAWEGKFLDWLCLSPSCSAEANKFASALASCVDCHVATLLAMTTRRLAAVQVIVNYQLSIVHSNVNYLIIHYKNIINYGRSKS